MITIKRGDTLLVSATVRNKDRSAVNLTGYTVASEIRNEAGTLLAALTATITSPTTGVYTLSASPGATATWPAGSYFADVKYTSGGGQVTHTATFPVRVLPAVTA